jgi:Carboxypeptidase regulatory-like domain
MSKKVWVATITTIGTVLAAYFSVAHFSEGKTVKTTLSGIVRDKSGFPISGAKVSITEDRDVPEVIFSDSDGVFHVEIRPKLHSLRVTIDATGYREFVRDENPERNGPLEVILENLDSEDKIDKKKKSDGQPSVHVEASGLGSTAVLGDSNVVKNGTSK